MESRPAGSSGTKAADGDSIDTLIAALYDTISGPAGVRDWDRFRELFIDGGILTSTRIRPDGTQVLRQMSVEDYIEGSGEYFEKNDFFESEISRKVDVFGSIAHAFSTYETRREPDAIPVARGINSFQAMHDDKGWRIVSIFWTGESDRNPIPEQYLP
ncbi:MAG: hypothetical protein IID30_10380 [Planctomycetes bacterium]|nr:hypothetical protein [Planctomycetota bacterium]